MSKNTLYLARSGLIAGLYVVLTLITFPIASGFFQFRASEGLTLLPLIFPEAIVGVTVGCLISNIITGCAFFDVLLGSLVTLVAALLTWAIGKIIRKQIVNIIIGGIFPVILNAVFLPLIWVLCYSANYVYGTLFISLIISQTLSVYIVGVPVVILSNKYKNSIKLKNK